MVPFTVHEAGGQKKDSMSKSHTGPWSYHFSSSGEGGNKQELSLKKDDSSGHVGALGSEGMSWQPGCGLVLSIFSLHRATARQLLSCPLLSKESPFLIIYTFQTPLALSTQCRGRGYPRAPLPTAMLTLMPIQELFQEDFKQQ